MTGAEVASRSVGPRLPLERPRSPLSGWGSRRALQPAAVVAAELPEEFDEVLQPLLERISAYSARPAQVIVH